MLWGVGSKKYDFYCKTRKRNALFRVVKSINTAYTVILGVKPTIEVLLCGIGKTKVLKVAISISKYELQHLQR